MTEGVRQLMDPATLLYIYAALHCLCPCIAFEGRDRGDRLKPPYDSSVPT